MTNPILAKKGLALHATTILSYAVLLGGVLTIAVAFYMVVVSYSSLPYWDGWSEIGIGAAGENPLSPAWLWHQHNEHRLVIPKLFLAADLRLFRARQVFLLASIFVIQFLHLVVLSWSMRVLGGWRGARWRAGSGLTAFCLFCPSQWQNFVWGFQVCFVLPQLFATLSFVALLLYWKKSQQDSGRSPPWRCLEISILSALAATCSLANGVLLWPLLVVAALYLRLRRAALWSIAIAGVISTGLYFYRYSRPPAHADPIASMGAPLYVLRYCAIYFLSSWTHRNTQAPELIALAGLAIVMVLLPVLSFTRISQPFTIQLVLTILFCGATALITAAGRLNLGLAQSFSSRYQAVALLFWCCLGLLLLGATFAHPRRRHSFLLAQVCLLAIFARGAAIAHYPIEEARNHGFGLKVAEAALLTNVNDPARLGEVYQVHDVLLAMAQYMKANHLSVFSGGFPSQQGKPLEFVFPLAAFDSCAGTLESIVSIDDAYGRGLRVAGWAWDRKHGQPPREIVATTNGIISGLGAVGEWRQGVRAMKPRMSSSYIGYVGYVPEPPPGSIVILYAILPGSPPTACYLATK